MPGQVNEYCIDTSEGADQEAVLAAAQEALPPGSVAYAGLGSEHPARELLDIDVQMFRDLSEFFPLLFLIVAAFSLYMVITRLVFSQRKTIGTMMSCGMKPGKIALHYLSYSSVDMGGGLLSRDRGGILPRPGDNQDVRGQHGHPPGHRGHGLGRGGPGLRGHPAGLRRGRLDPPGEPAEADAGRGAQRRRR